MCKLWICICCIWLSTSISSAANGKGLSLGVAPCPPGWTKVGADCILPVPDNISGSPESFCNALAAKLHSNAAGKTCRRKTVILPNNGNNGFGGNGGLPPPGPPPPGR